MRWKTRHRLEANLAQTRHTGQPSLHHRLGNRAGRGARVRYMAKRVVRSLIWRMCSLILSISALIMPELQADWICS